jgi:hypothetical protein
MTIDARDNPYKGTDISDEEAVYLEISQERRYQDKRWGHEVDDTLNTPWMWCAYVTAYATKWMAGTFAPLKTETVDDFRAKMVKTAAICLAAIESLDRQRAENGRAFYEQESD